jgi:hypothetical protein
MGAWLSRGFRPSPASHLPAVDDDESQILRRRALIALGVLYACWYLYTMRAKHSKPDWGHRWAARFAAACCHYLAVAMGLRLTVRYDGEPGGLKQEHRGLVAAVGPHGVFPLAMLGMGAFKFRPDTPFAEDGLKDLNARFAGASILFCVPVLRELLLLMGVRDVSRPTVRKLLAANHSIAIQPGGIWEMVMSDSSQEALYYQKSLGFVRLAMEFGRPLLPAYSFGENQVCGGERARGPPRRSLFRGCLHTPVPVQDSPLPLLCTPALSATSQLFDASGGHGLRLWVARRLRIGLPFFRGRWGVPLSLLPRPSEVTFVVGRRVPTTLNGEPNLNPTDAEVEAVFERYIEEVCRLFLENAPKYLPPEIAARGLKIVRIGHGVVRHALPPPASAGDGKLPMDRSPEQVTARL